MVLIKAIVESTVREDLKRTYNAGLKRTANK